MSEAAEPLVHCCGTCCHWAGGSGAEGQCRENSPQTISASVGHPRWPSTRRDEWCGRWRDPRFAAIQYLKQVDAIDYAAREAEEADAK